MKNVDKSVKSRKEALDTMYDSTGYSSHCRDPNFEFNCFSVDQTQKAVLAALDSKLSVPGSSKHFVTPLTLDFDEKTHFYPNSLRKGQKLVRTPMFREDGSPMHVFMEEGVAEKRRDNPGNTACSNCGSPHNLKACSGCKQRYYCSRSCQRVRPHLASFYPILKPCFAQAQWAQGHKKECNVSKTK